MLTLCLGLMILAGVTTQSIAGMLVAVSLAALFELPRIHLWLRRVCPLLFCALTLFVPSFVVYLPLAAGDLYRLQPLWIRGVWLLPLSAVALLPLLPQYPLLSPYILIATGCFCLLSCLMSWRALRISQQQELARIERDRLAQSSHLLEQRNRDLAQRQDLERELVTLDERSRIAREIHDNAGHLLTRSILQVKALEVTHLGDEQLTAELSQICATLDSAFDTIRKSVHDLYEESSGLETQLEALARSAENIDFGIEYRCADVPAKLANSLLAIVHEALANTQRHSDATSVKVSLVEFPGLYQLVVHDNGSVDPGDHIQRANGLGLASIAERTRAQGGIFRTSYDHGFKLFVSIPKASRTEA